MEFPHELKRVYPNEIVEVRGNADALTVKLKSETDLNDFIRQLKTDFGNIDEKHTLYVTIENSSLIEKIILG